MVNKRVFALGNGESRKSVDLNKLYELGIIYGCNALYRDFEPNALVVVDPKMKEEICETDYLLNNKAYFKYWSNKSLIGEDDWAFKATSAYFYKRLGGETSTKRVINSNDIIHKKFPDDAYRIGYSSGPASVLIASIEEKPNEVYLIGHDIYSTTGKFNNVYKDTFNYEKSDTHPTPTDNWVDQLGWSFKDFPHIEFYHVGGIREVIKWKEYKNLHYLTLDEMWKRLNR